MVPKTYNFTTISAYKRPAGAYNWGNSYKLFTVCGQLHERSGIKSWADSLKWLLSYEGCLSLGVCTVHVTQYFQRPLAANLCVGGEHVLKCKQWRKSRGGRGGHVPLENWTAGDSNALFPPQIWLLI